MRTNKTQDLIKAFMKINKYGRSEISIDTYIRSIWEERKEKRNINRNLAFAELVSRLAPEGKEDEWYIAGLLNDIRDIVIPGITNSPKVMPSILKKAHLDPGLIYDVESFRGTEEPQRWSSLTAAMNFADTHIDEEGNILTTEECCRHASSDKRCNACMYARYALAQTGSDVRAEQEILTLRRELHEREIERKRREDSHADKRQGRMEERGSAANAVFAG